MLHFFVTVLEIKQKGLEPLLGYLVRGYKEADTFQYLQSPRMQILVVCSEISFSNNSYYTYC